MTTENTVIEQGEALKDQLEGAISQAPTQEELHANFEAMTNNFMQAMGQMNRAKRRELNKPRHYPFHHKKFASEKTRNQAYDNMLQEKARKWSILQSWMSA